MSVRSFLLVLARGWLLLVLVFAAAAPARAQDAGAETNDAGGTRDPRALQIESLGAGTLEVGIDPQSLFDVPLADEEALAVERARLATLLRTADEAASTSSKRPPALVASARADLANLDPARWRARIEMDRARLAFYELAPGQRQRLLADHAARVLAATPKETDAERARREADEERARVLTAAREARSEAERLVAEELARLIDLERAAVGIESTLEDERRQLLERRDAVLAWQRRVRDVKGAGHESADALYDELRASLRASRDAQDRALDALGRADSAVPALGDDPLSELPADVSAADAARRRTDVAAHLDRVRVAERALLEDRAVTLESVIDTLNAERLDLLPYLSPAKRHAITGFTTAGLDQARSEARQLLLILRYHQHRASSWLRVVRQRDGIGGVPYWRVVAIGVPWSIAAFAFAWWRRRSPGLLALLEKRLASDDRSERRTQPSLARRALSFLRRVHGPLEWLGFFALTVWLLPGHLQAVLELQLLGLTIGWSLAGALVVNVIDALSSVVGGRAHGVVDNDELRLRSLRLVGRVVVVYALVLAISARLVGEGTIYRWVWSTCWIAALPVFLVLVRWWRATVFERVARVRRKTPVQAWILRNSSGYESFFAAMVAAVHLFALGGYKTVRNWLAGFDLARRGHAYLFRRGLARRATEETAAAARPLSSEAHESLSPARQGAAWIACPADTVAEAIGARIDGGQGGVVAVVGARGMGKSTLLRLLAQRHGAISLVDCRSQGVAAPESSCDAVLLDDAHALVKPVVGGLVAFDRALGTARSGAPKTLWVFTIDEAVWPFLRRARDARPIFDDVFVLESWSDEAIGSCCFVAVQRPASSPRSRACWTSCRLRPTRSTSRRQSLPSARGTSG